MKRYKTWVIAGVALTTMGVLAGCGTSGGASSPTLTNTISNATNNTKAVGPSNNSVTNSTESTNNTNSTGTSQTIAVKPDNFDVVSFVAPHEVMVGNVPLTNVHTYNGTLEPVILTVNLTKVTQPIYFNLQNLILNNPSSNIGGGVEYYQYNNVIYKTSPNARGSFPMKSTLVISKDSTVTLICTVGTPVPPAKVNLVYDNLKLGSYSASTKGSYTLDSPSHTASATKFSFYIKFLPNTTLPVAGGGPGGNSAPLGTINSGTTGWVKSPYQPGWFYGIGSGNSLVVITNQPNGPQLSGIPNNTSYVIKGHQTNRNPKDTTISSGTTSSNGGIPIPDKPGWDITIQYSLTGVIHSVQIRIPEQ